MTNFSKSESKRPVAVFIGYQTLSPDFVSTQKKFVLLNQVAAHFNSLHELLGANQGFSRGNACGI